VPYRIMVGYKLSVAKIRT